MRTVTVIATLTAAWACTLSFTAAAQGIPSYIDAAVADVSRPESDTKRDVDQKPAELLLFAGVKPGDRIADFWPLPPYSTRLLSKVAGVTGHVYAVVPEKLVREVPVAETDVTTLLANYANTTVLIQAFDKFSPPESLDVVWLGKIYHDFPNREEMGPLDIAAVNRAIFRALKPGGVYILIDHAAAPGSGFLDTEPRMPKRLHRIDPDIVRQQVTAAGFILEAESRILANPNDPHTKSVFDASIREKTDRFVFKFRKPRL